MKNYWNTIADWYGAHLASWVSLGTLLSLTPPTEWRFMWVYVGFAGVQAVGIPLTYFLPIHASLKARIYQLFWTNVILSPILFFFRFEGVPLFGMDVWRTLQELATVIWIGYIVYYVRTGLRQELLTEAVHAYKGRYLPKAK